MGPLALRDIISRVTLRPVSPEGMGWTNLTAHKGGDRMANYDRNIPTDPQRKQWSWFAMTVASVVLAIVMAVF